MTSRALTEYVVLDIEGSGVTTNKFAQADAQVSRHTSSQLLAFWGPVKACQQHVLTGAQVRATRQASSAARLQPGQAVHARGCCQQSPVSVLTVFGCKIWPVPLMNALTRS